MKFGLLATTFLTFAFANDAFAFGGKPIQPSPEPTQTVTHTATHTATSTHTATHTNTVTETSTSTATETSIEGRPSNAPNETVCAGAAALPGLDVSDYDPGTSWPTVARGGNGFTYVKATEGDSYVNPLFRSDWAAAKGAGLLRGAYHFFHPKDDPRVQAQHFLGTQGMLGASDLPAMLDWEVTDGVSNAVQIASAQVWLEEVKAATGKTPVIYVDPSFYNDLGNPPEFAGYPLFIAHYDVRCPEVPPPWSKWTFWQRGTGPLNGVSSKDADLDEFNGTAAQLLDFAKNGVRP